MRHGHAVAGPQTVEGLPAVNGQEGVRESRLHGAAQPRRDAEDGLDAVVNVMARRGQPELEVVAEREQARCPRSVDLFNRPDAAVGEHDLAVEGDALSHRRPGGDDDEVRRLEAGGHRVELGEAGGEAGEHDGATGHLLDFFEELVGDRLDVREPLPGALVGEREDQLLCVVEDDLGLVLAFERLARDLVGDADELAH